MKFRTALAALLILTSSASSCTSRDTPPSLDVHDSEPAVELKAPPALPPQLNLMELETKSSEWKVIQEANILNGEWSNAGKVRNLGVTARRVPWPLEVQSKASAPIAIHIQSATEPTSLTLRAFNSGLKEDGVPNGSPTLDLECTLFQLRTGHHPCAMQAHNSGYLLPLFGLRESERFYLSLNASWSFPLQELATQMPGNWATWLFAFSKTGA